MTITPTVGSVSRRLSSLFAFRVWHLSLLLIFIAIAIQELKEIRPYNPALVVLAASGLALYAVLGWIAWHRLRPLESRLGSLPLLILYMVAMALFYWFAANVYLHLEHLYLQSGH